MWLDFKKPHGIRTVSLSEAQRPLGIRMAGLLETSRYSFGWTLGGSSGFRMVGLSEAPS